jgi:Protein of unknown function (DUF455)
VKTFPSPLAGLCSYDEAALPGISVDTTVSRLRRYVYLKSQLVFTMAAHFNNIPEWEVKGALSLHLWQDAEHSTSFRTRVTEMRTPPHNLDKTPDETLAAFIQELRGSKDTIELLVGIYSVLKPAMLAAFNQHMSTAHKIADHPTRRLLRFVSQEEEEQIAWGETAITALLSQDGRSLSDPSIQEWREHLLSFIEAAGDINGDGPTSPAPAFRGTHEEPSRVPRRDARFERVWKSRGVVPNPEQPVHERIWWMMNVRLNEMHVSELIASVIADWKGQPWEFYHDLSRHLWDETRHCMLGEVAFVSKGIDFTKIPTHVGFAEYPNTQLEPADRYVFLWGIEQGLMVKSGKQAEVALAKAGEDERATVFQDFDWADEVLHAQIGRRWLETHYGDRKTMQEAYERVRPPYDEMKDIDLAAPDRNWWPEFYEKHLKNSDPGLPSPSFSSAETHSDSY